MGCRNFALCHAVIIFKNENLIFFLSINRCGHFPFKGPDDKTLFRKIKLGDYTEPTHLTEGAKHLISKLLSVNPEDRITAD